MLNSDELDWQAIPCDVIASDQPLRLNLQLRTAPTSHAVSGDARMRTTTIEFPPLFRAEGSLFCSPLRYILLLFALHPHFAIFCNKSVEPTSMDGRTEDFQPDSPAVPGRADAMPVSRSPTSPSGSHVAPQMQPQKPQSRASVEEADEKVVDPHIADKPIIETLKECTPKRSKVVLERPIHDRRERAEAKLKCDCGSMMHDAWTPARCLGAHGARRSLQRTLSSSSAAIERRKSSPGCSESHAAISSSACLSRSSRAVEMAHWLPSLWSKRARSFMSRSFKLDLQVLSLECMRSR